MHSVARPDVDRELARLKSFQRDSVEYVFQRMYRDSPPARHFLVADEVGLGKTMVARGVVAKALHELWDRVDRIDVIYICSNGSIARQNINRLNVTDAKDAALPSRITLLPKVVHGLRQRKVNFISLTPRTSFSLRSNLGTFEERGLLHRMLPPEWTDEDGSRNALQGAMDRDRFRRHVDELRVVDVEPDLMGRFHQQLGVHAELQVQFAELCKRFTNFRGYDRLPDEDRQMQRDLVGRLRLHLAISCLRALEPDLVIIDEFQRFKHLLDGTDQAGMLAQDLFTFGDARVLLLSATPYKMYTTGDDPVDDHYRDFMQTIEFLQAEPGATRTFTQALSGYREAIFKAADGEAVHARTRLEQELRRVMVRTERLAIEADRNGMLTEVRTVAEGGITAADVDAYLAAARIARAVGQPDAMEYWKASPYLLNFMDDYQLKESFTQALEDPRRQPAVQQALRANPTSLLNWDAVERFLAVDPQNARMRTLIADLIDAGAWRLLWLPPALPYYALSGPYADIDGSRLTKRLVFSSWHVVPKAVAALLSYEAERRMAGDGAGAEGANSPEERKRRQGLLRFARREGALANMSVLGLLYPGISLAEAGDPLILAREEGRWLTQAEMVERIQGRIEALLRDLPTSSEAVGAEDERWYWAAPILLDLHRHPQAARRWLLQNDLATQWTSAIEQRGHADEDDGADAWSAHVAEAQRLASGTVQLGRRPADLTKVLAVLALGAPSNAALRALARISGGLGALQDHHLRNEAGWVAWAFRSLFNLPEVATLIRGLNAAEPYWLRVADYCVAGGLQAVLDEYAHVLLEHEGVAHKPAPEATRRIAHVMASALQIRTANVGVDDIRVEGERSLTVAKRHMRARFAARFGSKQTDDGAAAERQDDVRNAFNSPFWPFVLCSTSVGQEGLDFHLYCHAVVHWNLPSNPVDLEQREGRVHRFKGHAVRKNAAALAGSRILGTEDPDPWEAVFYHAREQRSSSDSDLVPYWVLPMEGGATIERHVPALPLSREVGQLAALRRSLTIYRMAFGQNRQDDIVSYLQKTCSAEQLAEMAAALKIDLAPPRAGLSSVEVRRTAVRSVAVDGPDGQDAAGPSVSIDVQLARTLLDSYRDIVAQVPAPPIERYTEMLDQYARLAGR